MHPSNIQLFNFYLIFSSGKKCFDGSTASLKINDDLQCKSVQGLTLVRQGATVIWYILCKAEKVTDLEHPSAGLHSCRRSSCFSCR